MFVQNVSVPECKSLNGALHGVIPSSRKTFLGLETEILTWSGFCVTRGVLPEKLGRGVRPASQNPIYDLTKNLIPYLWPDS